MEERPLKVLIIEPGLGFTRRLKKLFAEAEKKHKQRFELEYIERLSLGLEHLSKGGIDVLLLDLFFPECTGLEALSRVYAKAKNTAIVILLDKDKSKLAGGALYNGAMDCLLKDELDSKLLIHSLRFSLKQHQLYLQLIQAKEKVEVQEAQFRELIEKYLDTVIILDMQKIVRFVNPVTESLYGCNQEELLGEEFSFPIVLDKIVEIQIARKSGKMAIAQMRAVKIDWQGENAYLVMLQDITERKKIGERLLAAAEEWRTTFDSIPDMVSIHDKDYKIIRVNKSFADRLKMRPKDVIGKTCYDLVHGTNEPPPGCPHRGTLETKMPQHSEYFEPHLDMYIEVTTSPIFNEKGDAVASVHIARDISHRKKLEKNQRLAELGKLVADMAHEVNNPLMIISGNAQLSLLDGTLNEEVKSSLKIIHEESNRAKDVIQRLLKYSRPTKGERKETDINQCVESITKLIEHQFSLSDIQIKKDLSKNLPAIVIDEKQIQEVLMNLLNNAREAMPDGGTINISTSLEQDFLRIDVKDSGMGMDEETLSKIFEPFFTTKEKGTGLGIPVCQGIVKAHNGELKFESQPGKGTTATVMLPMRGG